MTLPTAESIVDDLQALLDYDPQSGGALAAQLRLEREVVYEALVWMEARGMADLRPCGRDSNFAGWVLGRVKC